MNDITIQLLLDLNTDKYVHWLLNRKPVNSTVPIPADANLDRYRGAVSDFFYDTALHNAPTAIEIKHFPEWRKSAFEQWNSLHSMAEGGNPLSANESCKRATERTFKWIFGHYADLLPVLLNGAFTEEYQRMACLLGHIDYLKSLYTVSPVKAPANMKQRLTHNQIALILVYSSKDVDSPEAIELMKVNEQTSDKPLKRFYNKYFNSNDRKGLEPRGKDDGIRASKNKLKAILSIIPHLTGAAIIKAKEEAGILEAAIYNDKN